MELYKSQAVKYYLIIGSQFNKIEVFFKDNNICFNISVRCICPYPAYVDVAYSMCIAACLVTKVYVGTVACDNKFTLSMRKPLFVALISSWALAEGVSVPMPTFWAKLNAENNEKIMEMIGFIVFIF
jgi:hypothetical protein